MSFTKIALATIISLSTNIVNAEITQGMIAHWNFDTCTGADSSGNNNNINMLGSVSCAPGIDNSKGVKFDGFDDYLQLPFNHYFSTNTITLSAWIKPTGSGQNNPRIIAIGKSGSYAQAYSLLLEGTSTKRKLIFILSDYSTETWVLSTSYISDNSGWHHVAATYDGTRATVYIDGVRRGQIATTQPIASTSDVISVGDSDNGLDSYIGSVDDVRIYNRALSTTEIATLAGKTPLIKGNIKGYTSNGFSVACLNQTTGQTINLQSMNFDCGSSGLTINSGDVINLSITGKAK